MRADISRTSGFAAVLWIAMVGPSVALDGWSRTMENGGALFACRASGCGNHALISCRVVVGNAITSTDQFEARIRSQAEALRVAGRTYEAGPTSRSDHGGRVLYEAAFLVRGPGGRGVEQFRTGYLVAPTETFSIVSSSADAKTTRRNFDRFVAHLLSRATAAAVAECLP